MERIRFCSLELCNKTEVSRLKISASLTLMTREINANSLKDRLKSKQDASYNNFICIVALRVAIQ